MLVCQLFTFLLVLCFLVIRTSADISLVKILQRQERYKDSQIYFDHESEKNGTLHYMLCHRTKPKVSCTIFKEKHYVDKLPRFSLCNVTLEVEYPYVKVGKRIRVLPLNPSKALILWVGIGGYGSGAAGIGEASSLRYSIVDFDTCKIDETIITTSAFGPAKDSFAPLYYPVADIIVKSAGFAFYDNYCDIAFHDWRCGTGFCRLRIDKNTGNVISYPDFWYKQQPETIDIVPKNTQDPDAGNFFFGWKDGVIYKLVKDKGLDYFPTDYYHEYWQKFRYSVRDHFITVCLEVEETRVMCDQIDYNGTITMNANFDLQKKNVAPVPYTLRGGGFLLLTTECESSCTEGVTNHVYNVGTDGKLSKLVDIEGFNCNTNEFSLWHKFFENEQESLCVSLLCYESKISEMKYSKTVVPGSHFEYIYLNTPLELHVRCLNISNF